MVEKNSKLIPVEQIIERTIDSRKKRKKVVFFSFFLSNSGWHYCYV